MDERPLVYYLTAYDGPINYRCDLFKETPANSDQVDFETNYKSGVDGLVSPVTLPFASKKIGNNKKLFRRKHGYALTLAASGITTYTVTVPYLQAKINEAEIVWAPEGVIVDMKVKDSTSGTYTTVPNYILSQYGYSVVVSKDFFKDTSQYDADVYVGMQLEFTFNNSSETSKVIGLNIVFHEIV